MPVQARDGFTLLPLSVSPIPTRTPSDDSTCTMNTLNQSVSQIRPGPPRKRLRLTLLSTLLTITLALLAGCASSPDDRSVPQSAQNARNPEDLFVVDCALPGQVRQLGQNFTYLAPRQAVKTTAFDCALRGGEYAAYDRASYETALNVWLPRAKTGDMEAQTYVGEIYEKGLGIAPDYEKAAFWYEKAASQGSSRAKINLGYLYEKGTGVDQDIPAALNLYREASGLEDDELAFASTIEVETQARMGAARKQIEQLEKELYNSREESVRLKQQLNASRGRIRQERARLNRALDELEDARRKLDSSKRSAPAPSGSPQTLQYRKQLEKAQADVLQERNRLKKLESEYRNNTDSLERKLSAAEQKASSYEKRLQSSSKPRTSAGDREAADIARRRQEAKELDAKLARRENKLREKLDRTLGELEQTQQKLESLKSGSGDGSSQQLMQYRKEMDQKQSEVLIQRDQLKSLEQQHAEEKLALRKKLQAEQQKSGAYERTLKKSVLAQASLESKLENTETRLASLQKEYESASAVTANQSELNQKLQQQEAELRQQKQQSEALTAQMEALAEKNRRAEAELAAKKSSVSTRETELSGKLSEAASQLQQSQQEIARLEQTNQALIAERDSIRSSTTELSGQQKQQLQTIETRMLEQSRALEIQRHDSQTLVEKIEALSAENRSLKDQIGKAGTTVDSSLQSLAEQLSATATDLKKRQQTITQLESEKQNLAESARKQEQTSQQQLKQKDAELEKLRADIRQYEQTRENLLAQLSSGPVAPVPVVAAVSSKPTIELIDPPLTSTRGTLLFKLRSPVKFRNITGNASAAAGIMSLTINDRSETVNPAGLFTSKIPVQNPETPVNITLIDNSGGKASLNFVMVPGTAAPPADPVPVTAKAPTLNAPDVDFGPYHALLIGNEKYKNLPTLDTPIDDIREIDRILRTKYRFRTTVLTNANRYDMLSALNTLRGQLNEKTNLLIYYAGHGEVDKVNQRGQWLPIDAEMDSTANWISTRAVTDIINTMSAKHILVVADSCYSGAMTRTSLARLDPGMSAELKVKWLKTMALAKSRTVLTSGGVKPVLDSGANGHSIFARALINALNRNSGILEGQALYRTISGNVRKAASRIGFDQSPQYGPIRHTGHESGDFFFVPKA